MLRMLCVTSVGTCYRNTNLKALAVQKCHRAVSLILFKQTTSTTRKKSMCRRARQKESDYWWPKRWIVSEWLAADCWLNHCPLFGEAEALRTETVKGFIIIHPSLICLIESPWQDLVFTLQMEWKKKINEAKKAKDNHWECLTESHSGGRKHWMFMSSCASKPFSFHLALKNVILAGLMALTSGETVSLSQWFCAGTQLKARGEQRERK